MRTERMRSLERLERAVEVPDELREPPPLSLPQLIWELRKVIKDLKSLNATRPRFLSLAQAESAFGISRRRLRELIADGELRAYSIAGEKIVMIRRGERAGQRQRSLAKVLVDPAELEAFIRNHAVVDKIVEKMLKR